MKKILVIAAIGFMSLSAICQTNNTMKARDGITVGPKSDPNAVPISKITVETGKLKIYSSGTNLLENVSWKDDPSVQLGSRVILKTQMWIDSVDHRIHYTSGDSTYIVAIASKSLTNAAPPATNLIYNGDFTTNADGWTLGQWGWVVSGGKLNKTENGGSSVDQITKTLDYNTQYTLAVDIVCTGGAVTFATGFGGGIYEQTFSSTGHYSVQLPTAANANNWENQFYINCNYGFLGSIDNIVMSVTP